MSNEFSTMLLEYREWKRTTPKTGRVLQNFHEIYKGLSLPSTEAEFN
jgi:hypothetical protein